MSRLLLLCMGLLVWSQAGFSEGAPNLTLNSEPKILLSRKGEWKAFRILKDGDPSILFELSDKKKVEFKPPVEAPILLSAEAVKLKAYDHPVLVSIWMDGAHVSVLRILDPLAKGAVEIHGQSSLGLVNYRVTSYGILRITFGEYAPDGEAREVLRTEEWPQQRESQDP